ncbi:MAG TPA: TIGR02147 family protein [Polyangiaceae bacterium]|nr:TIGR02147 family protein [Polyangiaceae bacterium]
MPSNERSRRSRAPVDVFRYRDYREFLAAFYAHAKAAGLSYRGFARAAGLGAPNYLKLVIDGKRNLSREMATRFAAACRLNAESTEYFELLVALNQADNDAERNEFHERLSRFARFRSSQRLDVAQHEYHSSWFIPVIRELVSCPGFVEDPAWIAAQLEPAISEKEAAHALDVLQRLGLLERDESGQLGQATRAVTTGQQASGLHIRNYHAEVMQRAVRAMHELPPEERYISALTLSASAATWAEVMRRVIAFRQELVTLCDADPAPARVVQLNLQLFPLTRPLTTAATPAAKATPRKAAAVPRRKSKRA